MILEQCKRVHCVDLVKSFQTHIYLQNLASMPPRTSPVKFARRREQVAQRAPDAGAPGPGGAVAALVLREQRVTQRATQLAVASRYSRCNSSDIPVLELELRWILNSCA